MLQVVAVLAMRAALSSRVDSLSVATALASDTAWRGPELARDRASWVLELNDANIQELMAAVEATAALPIAEIRAADHPLATLGPKLRRVKEALMSGPGIALLRNVPTSMGVEASARAFWLLGLHLGETTPVPQNKQGHLLGHVYDLGNDPAKPETRIYTTSAAQPYHTDSADLVGLMRAAGVEPATRISWSRASYPHQLESNQVPASAGVEPAVRISWS